MPEDTVSAPGIPPGTGRPQRHAGGAEAGRCLRTPTPGHQGRGVRTMRILNLGEQVTTPSLPAPADWAGLRAARPALGANLPRARAAARYTAAAANGRAAVVGGAP